MHLFCVIWSQVYAFDPLVVLKCELVAPRDVNSSTLAGIAGSGVNPGGSSNSSASAGIRLLKGEGVGLCRTAFSQLGRSYSFHHLQNLRGGSQLLQVRCQSSCV